MAEKPQLTSTLEEFVAVGEDSSITYSSLSFQEIIGDISFPLHNVISDYIDDLIAISEEVELSEDDKYVYKYRPKLLSEFLYGNGELYYIILLINGMCNMKEFTLNGPIRVISRKNLLNMIKQIYKSEKSQIESYNEDRDS